MNDARPDLAPDGTVGAITPKTVPLWGVMGYIDHNWSEQWATSFGYSRVQMSNGSLQASNAFKYGEYASANLLYMPHKNVLMGIEGLWGYRGNMDGSGADDIRFQISMKFSFSSKDHFKL
jgi:hypothetical protein